MKAKTKKHIPVSPIIEEKSTGQSQALLSKANALPALLICLFIGVDFVPGMGGADVFGSQWRYLVIINFISIGAMLWDRKNNYFARVKVISTNRLSLLYTGLFLLAGASIFAAFNKTESVVCYARFACSLVSYFIIALLLYGRLELFRFFARLFTLLLFIKAVGILLDF